jgi:hypothetical protein
MERSAFHVKLLLISMVAAVVGLPHALLNPVQSVTAQSDDLINSRKTTVITTTIKKVNRFNNEAVDFDF